MRHLPAGDIAATTLRTLLGDSVAALRIVALSKVEQLHAASLAPIVETLTRDRATVWDLDNEIVVADVATRVLASLSR